MELISIRANNNNFELYIHNNNCIEIKFENTISNVFDYLKYFRLSNNSIFLEHKNGYDIYLDKESGLKHYIKNEQDNIKLLFQNNGQGEILYLGNDNINSKRKIFRIKNFIIICSLTGLLLVGNIFKNDNNIHDYQSYIVNGINNFSINDIKNMIYSSSNINIKEKNYLYNEDFLQDILPFINSSQFNKYEYLQHFSNMEIKSYEYDDNTDGFYQISKPNIINIKNYDGSTSKHQETIAHEFIHLCQKSIGYNLITEASAEIICHEYYLNTPTRYYYYQVKLLKELMEVIGSEPIWYYNFTSDFSKIEERVKPYLTNNEYQDFLRCLNFDYQNEEENTIKFTRLKELISILYKNIYNKNIEDDLIINLIENNDRSLIRYYFNQRYIKEENSYYYDRDYGYYDTVSLEEAINLNLITIYSISKKEILYSQVKEAIDNNYSIKREIDYTKNNVIITHRMDGNNLTYISGFIDNIKYENVNLDELYEQGIINVKYYQVNLKCLNYLEYLNKEYNENDEIVITHTGDTIINDNNVYGFIVPKTYLPTINDRYNINSLTL